MRGIVCVLYSLLICSAIQAGGDVIFFEAEKFDPNLSVIESGGVRWIVKEDPTAFGGKYVTPEGPSLKGATSLVYRIPKVEKGGGIWKLWVRAIMPKLVDNPQKGEDVADSFTVQLSVDGGKRWGKKKEVIAGGFSMKWKWVGWEIERLDKGERNLLKIIERECGVKLDLFCLRNDGDLPSDEEYRRYLESLSKRQPVEVGSFLPITWGDIKK